MNNLTFRLTQLATQDLLSIGRYTQKTWGTRHLIFYQETNEHINIIRILHERMDVESHFDEE